MYECDCEREKKMFIEAYSCYNWQDVNSLGEVIGLIPTSNYPHYPETPRNAIIFATTGTDDCHFCMVGDSERMNIYLICPNMDDKSIFLVGHSIAELLSYLLSVVGAIECVFDLNKDEFLQLVEDEKRERISKLNSSSFKNDLNALSKAYVIPEVSASEAYDKLLAMNAECE